MNDELNKSISPRSIISELTDIPQATVKYGAQEDRLYFRNNENPFGGRFRCYPGYVDDGLRDLAGNYISLLQYLEKNPPSIPLGPENVLLTQGAACALEQVFKTYFEPGDDSVILTPPYFSIFGRVAKLYNISIRESALVGDGFERLNIDEICATQARGIVLCDPNNPLGCRISPEDITLLLQRFNGLVIIDEAYVEYSRFPSNLHHLHSYENLLIIRTFSKAFGMAGLRIGCVIGAQSMISSISKVQLPFAISSVAASEASNQLGNRENVVLMIEQFRMERDRMVNALKTIPYVVRILSGDSGFITLQVANIDRVITGLRSAKIEPVFNPEGLIGYIRISLGSREQNTRLLTALNQLV